MTRAQRRIRSRKQHLVSAGLTDAYRDPFAAGISLATNPNRGKRSATAATAREHALTTAEADRLKASRRDYRPLTVRTPIKRARIAPNFTAYTI